MKINFILKFNFYDDKFLTEFQTPDLIILSYGYIYFQGFVIDLHACLPQVVCLHIYMHIQPNP